jgi:hypothetical protein
MPTTMERKKSEMGQTSVTQPDTDIGQLKLEKVLPDNMQRRIEYIFQHPVVTNKESRKEMIRIFLDESGGKAQEIGEFISNEFVKQKNKLLESDPKASQMLEIWQKEIEAAFAEQASPVRQVDVTTEAKQLALEAQKTLLEQTVKTTPEGRRTPPQSKVEKPAETAVFYPNLAGLTSSDLKKEKPVKKYKKMFGSLLARGGIIKNTLLQKGKGSVFQNLNKNIKNTRNNLKNQSIGEQQEKKLVKMLPQLQTDISDYNTYKDSLVQDKEHGKKMANLAHNIIARTIEAERLVKDMKRRNPYQQNTLQYYNKVQKIIEAVRPLVPDNSVFVIKKREEDTLDIEYANGEAA